MCCFFQSRLKLLFIGYISTILKSYPTYEFLESCFTSTVLHWVLHYTLPILMVKLNDAMPRNRSIRQFSFLLAGPLLSHYMSHHALLPMVFF